MTTRQTRRPGSLFGALDANVTGALAQLARDNAMARIWDRDHTVWRDDPTEIADRLGWLTVSRDMTERLGDLRKFANDVRRDGVTNVVLLGMGGSSLGPEALRQCIGGAPGYPALTVLDSTVPDRVASVTRAVDPARTLFVVSSKSGGTIEPNSFYKHFRAIVENAVGADQAGRRFAAITDAGTSLAALGEAHGFRRVFENPPDIGGRYSVGSLFGLVPAALCGMDCAKLLDRMNQMAARCEAGVGARKNPGAWLGAAIGALALAGRDKLTIIASPPIASFGLWAEQLIAESLGKDGKGVVPVVGEPLLEADAYGDDRAFAHVRLADAENAAEDVALERLRGAGHPVVTLDLDDEYDVGAEFFRWEMATAVAGHILGVHPFDQPNVQQAKDATSRMLETYVNKGAFPSPSSPSGSPSSAPGESGSVADLLAQASDGDYFAVMAYIEETEGVARAADTLRRHVMRRHRAPTTLGYGPRFLHSTGQLHKGGANNGLFLQFVGGRERDIPIPGEPFGFGALAEAQAIGDYEALKAAGRRVARVRLEGDPEAAILRLLSGL